MSNNKEAQSLETVDQNVVQDTTIVEKRDERDKVISKEVVNDESVAINTKKIYEKTDDLDVQSNNDNNESNNIGNNIGVEIKIEETKTEDNNIKKEEVKKKNIVKDKSIPLNLNNIAIEKVDRKSENNIIEEQKKETDWLIVEKGDEIEKLFILLPPTIYRKVYNNKDNRDLPTVLYIRDYKAMFLKATYMEDIVAMNSILKKINDVNFIDVNGDTPLIWAVRLQKLQSVRFLLHKNADPYKKNKEGMNAIEIALAFENIPIIKVLSTYVASDSMYMQYLQLQTDGIDNKAEKKSKQKNKTQNKSGSKKS